MSGRKQNITLPKLTNVDLPHLAVFAKHKHFYDFFDKTGELVNFHAEIQNELLTAYHNLFDPYYHYQRTCAACVAGFLTLAYRQYLGKYGN
jgi:hypothetical protein